MSGPQFTPGRWYVAEYGFGTICGPCVASCQRGAVLAFRWGTIFRERNFVEAMSIICEVPPPWHVRLLRWLLAKARGES